MSSDRRPATSERADQWIAALGLQVLEQESGWWAPAARSMLDVTAGGQALVASSSIYYLLEPGRPINVWHWLASDDTHVLVEGGPVEYILLPEGQPGRRQVLGRDVAAGQAPVVAAPARCWKALRLLDPHGYALMVTVVSPGWTPSQVQVGLPEHVRAQHLDSSPWLTPDLLETLNHDGHHPLDPA